MPIRLLVLTVFIMASLSLFGQAQNHSYNLPADAADVPYWVEMMQDPEINFYEVRAAFNAYWDGREVTKGSGYKPFKRWEYRMQQSRIFPDGERIPDGHFRDEYYRFLDEHGPGRSPSGNWTSLGPEFVPSTGRSYQGLGRLNAIAFHPTDPDIIFVGSPSGGLWKTTTGGNEWTSLIDDLPTLGVSSIIVDYSNPDRIYIGTGDRDAGDAYGLGVYRSSNGGVSWTEWSNGMGEATVGMMIQHPSNSQMILAATSTGIYKTINSGVGWYLVKSGNFKDIVFKPGDPNTIYATAGGNFYKSTNMGENFYQTTSGLPSGNRGVIGVSPADPEYVYFLLTTSSSFKGLYRSTDGGDSFSTRSTSPNIMSWGCTGGSGGQAWYDLDIAVDPFNEDVIFAGGVNCFKSDDGGASWNISSHWAGGCNVPTVHADLHILEYNPINWTLYVGNDGGIYYTEDQGDSWHLISNGLVISQVYKIGQSATVKDKVLNGYQDNGTSTYLGTHWQFTRGGDGFECAVDHEDAAYSYASIYYGNIDRYYNNSYDANVASDGNYGINETGAWVTPFMIDESSSDIMFIGYKNVWRCDYIKSPSWQLMWHKITDISTTSNMRVLEQSPEDPGILFAANHADRVYRTNDAHSYNPYWLEITNYLPGSGSILDLECHPFDSDIVYLSREQKIWKSNDQGMTWDNISGSLPNVSFTSIAFYENSEEGLYISSDIGVYYKDYFLDDWILFSNGLPIDASIQEIEIFYGDSTHLDIIRAGTYGRGLWESDTYCACPVAGFIASDTLIPVGCEISFKDMSAGIPNTYEWNFEGGTPSSSNEADPQDITFNNPGTYTITLVVANLTGSDTCIKTSYITVSDELLPEAGFDVSEKVVCSQGQVTLYDTSKYCPNGWQWSFEPNSVTFYDGTGPDSQNPVIGFDESGTYTVSLIAVNSNGTDTATSIDLIKAGGQLLPFVEDFEDNGMETNSWTIENPDNNYTWGSYVFDTANNTTAWMKHFAYFNMGERDRLISPYISFEGYDEIYLSFRHAYTQRFGHKDSLIVYVSYNCGDGLQRIFSGGPDGTGKYMTTYPSAYEFFPGSAEEWCGLGYGSDCYTLGLHEWADHADIRIIFETYNNLGNNLFLDDIMISNTTGIPGKYDTEEDFRVFPNPNDGSFTITGHEIEGPVRIRLFDLQGKVLMDRTTETSGRLEERFLLNNATSGFYLLSIRSNDRSFTKKLLIR